jgi:protein phosphatase
MTSLRAAAQTDIGRIRSENEDRMLCNLELGRFAVADGVGGLPGGSEAAQCAVELVGAETPVNEAALIALVQRTNEAVRELGRKVSPSTGIGSTLTAGWVRDGALHLGHVGDSRCYVWRAGTLQCLTEDHSMENEVRRRRARGENVSFSMAQRNMLTRCLGQPTPPEVDTCTRPLAAGDRYLFCTDGVSRLVTDTEIREALGRAQNPAAVIDELIQQALRRGGTDNATAVALFVE